MTEAGERELRGFGARARAAVARAEEEARSLRHPTIGTEHLLVALAADGDGAAGAVLKSAGVTAAAARHQTAQAVHTSTSPTGPLPTTPRAGRALVRAVRFSHQAQAHEVGDEHLLLGVLDVEGTANLVLRRLGADVERLRSALASGGSAAPSAKAPASRGLRPVAAPVCPGCGGSLGEDLAHHTITATGDGGVTRDAIVFACRTCGHALGASGT